MPIPDPLVRKVADALEAAQHDSRTSWTSWENAKGGVRLNVDYEKAARVAIEALGMTEERGEREIEELGGYVSREMASDAGEPGMEGMPIPQTVVVPVVRYVTDWDDDVDY